MTGANIYPDDILIADNSIDPGHNKIVFASINGELTVKQLYMKNVTVKIVPANDDFQKIAIKKYR